MLWSLHEPSPQNPHIRPDAQSDGRSRTYRPHRPSYACRKLVVVRTARQEGIQKLYHYQGFDPDHLKDILINNRVRCSNPDRLNDPWDCRVYFDDLHLDDPSTREKWGKALEVAFANLSAK